MFESPRERQRKAVAEGHTPRTGGVSFFICVLRLIFLPVHLGCLQQRKSTASALQDFFSAQLTDFRRQSASFYLKKVGQLLAVIWNCKGIAFRLFGLQKQKGHQFISCAPFGCDFDFLVKDQIFLCNDCQKIKNHLTMKGTGFAAGLCDALRIN